MPLKPSIKLIGDRILVKSIDQDVTAGGLFLPDSHKDEHPIGIGIVVRVGPGNPTPPIEGPMDDWIENKEAHKRYVPLQLAESYYVVYAKGVAVDVEIDGVKYAVMPQSAVLIYDEKYF